MICSVDPAPAVGPARDARRLWCWQHHQDRHRVRPGLAGWAQSNDLRGQTPVEERLIYDLYYIENWSLAFDLKILLITLFGVWTHKNAY